MRTDPAAPAGVPRTILAHANAALDERVQNAPLVAWNVVVTDVLEIAPGRIEERLAFLNL